MKGNKRGNGKKGWETIERLGRRTRRLELS